LAFYCRTPLSKAEPSSTQPDCNSKHHQLGEPGALNAQLQIAVTQAFAAQRRVKPPPAGSGWFERNNSPAVGLNA
jgi:hypothetical protein